MLLFNSDRTFKQIRVFTGIWLILAISIYSYCLGKGTQFHLTLLLVVLGMVQTFSYTEQDPWLPRLQILAFLAFGAVMLGPNVSFIGFTDPLRVELIACSVIGVITLAGVVLVYFYYKGNIKYYQTAAVEVDDFLKLVDNSPNALLVIDAQKYSVLKANKNFIRLFEFENEAAIPTHLINVIFPNFEQDEYENVLEILDNDGQWTAERSLKTHKGNIVQCSLVVTRMIINDQPCNLIRVFDRTKEIDAVANLERTKERLELALQASQDGIWEWDLAEDSLYISSRWKEMLGYSEEELPATYEVWQSLILDEDREPTRKKMYAYVKQKADSFFAMERYRHKDGSIVYIESRAVRVLGPGGRTIKVVGSHTDITSLIRGEQELREAKLKAEAANSAKSQFLANMSHEIRTPLTSILGFTEQLQSEDLDDRIQELVSFIASSGKTLKQLLLDILDFERIQQGKLELAADPFCPELVLDDLAELYHQKAKVKGLQFWHEVIWPKGFLVMGDKLRFRQVLVNLIENAFKFTEEGGIRIIALLRKVDGADRLCVCVTDSGPGIPQEFQENVFEAFTQYDPSFNRKHEGSGLGLGIVRQIVELMDGEIVLESPPNDLILDSTTGSRFIFSIPVTLVEEADVPQEIVTPKSALELPAQTVLLAEDNKLNRRIATHMLKKLGLTVLVAEDGVEAVATVEKHPETSLILMDIHMPNMDGYEACNRIKEIHPSLPIVGLSANAFQSDIDRAYRAGMDDYLAKPYDQDQIAGLLERWLSVPELR
ncbi:MAG: response regulator [Bacteroidia bacterium]